ncbi:ABC transporter ATP-binding protein [Sanguibacter sp. 25GB23B1]|uniref:energy-coupling factor ABC transporter ATP-binding protein n=1 Tax=unclassified Sanguibacter TaxID=2645534 RepID=UPI0032AED2C9
MIELDAASVCVEGPSGEVTILSPTTLTLTERRVSIIGANGSGKSTLARLVNGLALPTTGYVRVDGLDSHDDGAAVRRRVGFVFSDADSQIVMPTPLEDVALSLRRLGLRGRERTDRARAILARYSLDHLADVSVHALSGGQKQLLALAGVLATEPSILVCDEPTTLLDLRWRTTITALLAALDQQVVHVTHDLDAALLADRVLVVDEGSVVFDGEARTAVAHYRALMGTPA